MLPDQNTIPNQIIHHMEILRIKNQCHTVTIDVLARDLAASNIELEQLKAEIKRLQEPHVGSVIPQQSPTP